MYRGNYLTAIIRPSTHNVNMPDKDIWKKEESKDNSKLRNEPFDAHEKFSSFI